MVYADVPAGLRDEVVAALDSVETAIYRKRYGSTRDGKWRFSGGNTLYISRHAWREDVYSGEQVQKIDSFVVDKSDWGRTSLDFNDKAFSLTQTTVHFGDANYRIVNHGSQSHPDNPMDSIIRIASMLNKADRFWENEMIDGVECFGFELSAKKYGTNPDTHKHRMWFDVQTKLPVKTEFEWVQTDGPRRQIREKFQWNPALPADTFNPEIPVDFTLSEQN